MHTCSKNDVISSVLKGLGLELRIRLGLVEIHFRSNMFPASVVDLINIHAEFSTAEGWSSHLCEVSTSQERYCRAISFINSNV